MNPAAALAAIALAVPAVPVNHQACPGYGEYAGCYIPPPVDAIYVDSAYAPTPETQDVMMWHERGHAADIHFLTDGERYWFTCLHAVRVEDSDRSRCGQKWGPYMRELWADAYASCHFRELPSRGFGNWIAGVEYWPKTDRRQVSACRFIARAVSG